MRDLPEDNLSYPVLVQLPNETGSGFYFRNEQRLYLATALHVLYKPTIPQGQTLRDNSLKLISYDRNPTIQTPIELVIDLSTANIKKHPTKDVVLVEIANLEEGSKIILSNGVTGNTLTVPPNIVVVPASNLKKFADVLISNEVFILGYPNSLGIADDPQIDSMRPLLRKGVIAGTNTSRETIILDCPVYFGNSGGLAIEVERMESGIAYRVIGIVSQFVPFVEQLKSQQLGYTNLSFENSGYSVVIPVDTILELIAN